jgi:hypothetical protein
MTSARRRWRGRLLLALIAAVVALAGGEIALRVLRPGSAFVGGAEWDLWRQASDVFKEIVEVDPELGYRPRFGTRFYDEWGFLHTGDERVLARTPGRRRIVFLGDSATQRRAIELACRRRLAADVEIWNAGVEGYNTRQEVGYYMRFLHPAKPDLVVLTLHNNDFQSTPVVFFDEQDRLRVFTTGRTARGPNLWLFRNSYVYRLAFSLWVGSGERDLDVAAGEVERSLRELRDFLQARGAGLSVLVLPVLAPPGEWTDAELLRHERALAIVRALGLPHCDLRAPLERAAAAGVPLQETPGDRLHPSPAVADRFADAAMAQRLLD